MAAGQLRIAETELAFHRAAERHRAGDVVLVAVVFALDHLQQPAGRCRHLGADLGRIDDLQLQRSESHTVAGADLIALADLFVIDVGAAGRAEVGQVVEAVFQYQLGVKGRHAGIAYHQPVGAVRTEGEAFIGKPDGALTIVCEVDPEHVCVTLSGSDRRHEPGDRA